MNIKDAIRTIPNYPKPGIMFRDITTLLGNARAFRRAVDEMVQPYAGMKIDKVAGLEARGFILGGAVAHQLSVGFIPVRKKGKLPHKVIGEDYDLEYGKDRVEIHIDALEKGERVLLVDDLIATGGTLASSITGLPGHPIENVTLRNIRISMAGSGKVAKIDVPELPGDYPHAPMFGPLPASGLYARHVDGLSLDRVRLRTDRSINHNLFYFRDLMRIRISVLLLQCRHYALFVILIEFVLHASGLFLFRVFLF